MIRCRACGCTHLKLAWDNGAEYPQTRVETYRCVECGNRETVELTA